jgi:CRISPR-associated protein Csb2
MLSLEADVCPAIQWLEELQPPTIVAPPGRAASHAYRLYVPNNAGDVMVAAWARGDNDASMAEHRTEKDLRPTRFAGPDHLPLRGNPDLLAIHFDWQLTPEQHEKGKPHLETLKTAARSITHLGLGVDQAVGHAELLETDPSADPTAERWLPQRSGGGTPLRVPRAGTLADLQRRYRGFLGRLGHDCSDPVPTVSVLSVIGYLRATESSVRPLAAFEIHRTIEDQEKPENTGKSRFRPFHHVRRVAEVAGMVRYVTAGAARSLGWAEGDVVRRIEGHDNVLGGPATSRDRLQFLPLPSVTPVGVSGIRRVLFVGPPGSDLAPLRRHLNGAELINEDTKRPVAMLSSIATTDRNVAPYLGPASTWTTVTPVILPGFDDPDGLRSKLRVREGHGPASSAEQRDLLARLDTRIVALIWKAFHQAGWTDDALAGAHVEYRGVGWIRGLDLASNYRLTKAPFPRYHVRIQFKRPTSGPVVIGAGRYRGLGIFVREE